MVGRGYAYHSDDWRTPMWSPPPLLDPPRPTGTGPAGHVDCRLTTVIIIMLLLGSSPISVL